MGIMVSKDENNSELSRKISADLRGKVQSSRRSDPDYVDDAEYLRETSKTGKFTWVWILLIVLAVLSLVCILFI